MQPFTANAVDYNSGAQLIGVPFHATAQSREYLSPRPPRFIVCGLKGIGKTLLLVKRSQADRDTHPGDTFIPQLQLVEKLTELGTALPDSTLRQYSDPSYWRSLWLATLSHVIAMRSQPESLLEDEKMLFDGCECSVGATIRTIIDRSREEQYRRFVEIGAARLLARLRTSIRAGVRVYIDAIDELTNSHIGDVLKTTSPQVGRKSPMVWAASQIGFGLAAIDIVQSNTHVKIFATMRKEALDLSMSPLRQNLEACIVEIKYSLDDLKAIWRAKLGVLQESFPSFFCVQGGGSDVNRNFFGFDEIEHPYARDEKGGPIIEDSLSYLIRHTRGRPRELDHLGHELQYTDPANRNPDFIRNFIRESSKVFYRWAQTEPTPFWHEDQDLLLKAMDSNIFTRCERQRIFQLVAAEHQLTAEELEQHSVQLFRLGLMGYVKAHGGKAVQVFQQSDRDLEANDQEFLSASNYVVHPCVNLRWLALRPVYNPNQCNIVGHGLPFRAIAAHPHAHIGCGRLGLGLVGELLLKNRSVPAAFIQRCTPENREMWKLLPPSGESVSIVFNVHSSQDIPRVSPSDTGLTVLSDDADEDLALKLIDEWRSGSRNLVVYTASEHLVEKVLAVAESFSTAVGRGLNAAVELIAKHGQKNKLAYLFENDEQLILEAAQVLAKRSIRAVKMVVDRICTSVTLEEPDGRDNVPNAIAIVVACEQYFSLVVNDESARTKQLFAADLAHTDRVEFVRDEVKFDYLHHRKRLLVNGLHFMVAVFAYKKLIEYDIEICGAITSANLLPLIMDDSAVETSIKSMGQLIVARLVLRRIEIEPALGANESELFTVMKETMAYFQRSFERMQRKPDSLGRVLSADLKVSHEKFWRFYGNELYSMKTGALERHKALWDHWFYENWHDRVIDRLTEFKVVFDAVTTRFLRLAPRD